MLAATNGKRGARSARKRGATQRVSCLAEVQRIIRRSGGFFKVPSKWLAGLVKQSYLQEYPVQVVYNTIDTTVFKPTEGNFREKYNLLDKKIVLGVASVWEPRKGLQDFFKLAQMLDDSYRIVLVGLNDVQMQNLPKNIIGIKRTNSPQELAEIYTAADVFVNPTYEDNYPTVNLEAQACGTPVITYDTGGARETLRYGNAIKTGDILQLENQIRTIR